MKTISVKLDDYLLDVLNHESKQRKTTRMELIRSSIMNFLLHGDDAEDLSYIEKHKKDKLYSFEETFK